MHVHVCVCVCVRVGMHVCVHMRVCGVCVCLCLAVGIRPVGESWSEISRSSFKDMVTGKTLFALKKGRQDSGPTSVILLDTTTSSQIDKVIHLELVNLNHAAKTEH